MNLRRHFFLAAAIGVVVIMALVGGLKLAQGQEAAPGAGRGGPGGPGGGRAVTIEAMTVGARAFADRIEALGDAKARQSVELAASTTDLVTAVRFQSGQRVARGQVLVELNAAAQQADVMQAQAAVDQAEADWRRWRELADRGVAPRATAEQYEAAYNRARAALAAQTARRQDRVIRAPFSGVVGLSDAAPGMLVNPGTRIATLDDLSVIRVDFRVPERFLSSVRVGSPVTARSEALGDAAFTGRVSVLDTRIDPATRAVTARAEFPNPGGRMKPGMLMRVTLSRGEHVGPAVPEAAVQFQGDAASVWVLRADPERGAVAERREIVTGLRQDGWIEVTGGLQAGERIVATGVNRVQPGQPVRIAGEEPAGGLSGGAAAGGARRG